MRDKDLMEKIAKYLNCGKVVARGDIVDFQVIKLAEIFENIIPFFERHEIIGVKRKDFEDFELVADIMKVSGHLTPEGLERIKEIKLRMNANRGEGSL